MRVMTDTNIIIAALCFPESLPAKAFAKVLDEHLLVLCTYIVEELRYVFQRKFAAQQGELQQFLGELSCEMVATPKKIAAERYPRIRDAADLPILVSAIIADIDLLLTADHHFYEVNIKSPRIIAPYDFLRMEP